MDLSSLPGDTPLNPCGILSKYVFTDTFQLYNKNKRYRVPVNETNIVQDYVKDHVFKPNTDSDTVQWLDVTNGKLLLLLTLIFFVISEHFMAWQ